MYSFIYADKAHLSEVLPLCYDILYSNMNKIAPTGNTYDEDFSTWYACVFPAMQKDPRQIILMYHENTIVGYFQYYINDGMLMMEEIQIREDHHGTGLFRMFYGWFLNRQTAEIQTVEAYANKRNLKSQGILNYLGLTVCGENKNGNSYHYRGLFSDLSRILRS